MCYFEQTRWICGYWKWGNFRQQCNKEYRTGETCGLKLVFDTMYLELPCKICEQIGKKNRRLEKMYNDIERWHHEGNRHATIEKTKRDARDIAKQVEDLWKNHEDKRNSIG